MSKNNIELWVKEVLKKDFNFKYTNISYDKVNDLVRFNKKGYGVKSYIIVSFDDFKKYYSF